MLTDTVVKHLDWLNQQGLRIEYTYWLTDWFIDINTRIDLNTVLNKIVTAQQKSHFYSIKFVEWSMHEQWIQFTEVKKSILYTSLLNYNDSNISFNSFPMYNLFVIENTHQKINAFIR